MSGFIYVQIYVFSFKNIKQLKFHKHKQFKFQNFTKNYIETTSHLLHYSNKVNS